MIRLFIIIVLFSVFDDCNGQTKFEYKNLPKEYLISLSDSKLEPLQKRASKEVQNAYNLIKSLPKGYVKDGSVDYTNYIQGALNLKRRIVFPNFPLLISEKGLTIKSGTTIVFPEKSVLLVKPNRLDTYQTLRIHNVSNVSLYFPKIIGDRKKHLGHKGEWGMGLSIMGASNVKIYNPKISNCWGDGIYVGKGSGITKNVEIYYPILDNNRRNGLSIVSVDGMLIKQPIISNTNGTMPMSGIDIEPNNNNDTVDNIEILDPITFNSERYGILLVLRELPGIKGQNVNISISNHIDDTSILGVKMGGFNAKYTNGVPIKGNIKIINPHWKNNMEKFTINKNIYSPNVFIQE